MGYVPSGNISWCGREPLAFLDVLSGWAWAEKLDFLFAVFISVRI